MEEKWNETDTLEGSRRIGGNCVKINNILMELNNIYMNKITKKHKHILLRSIRRLLNRLVDLCSSDGKKSSSHYHFSLILPTHWDYDIREKLLRPLFINSKLISKNDDQSRLLFFTTLESVFPYLQASGYYEKYKIFKDVILNGQHFIMYSFNISNREKMSVKIDLFSSHYPFIKSINKYYVPNLLNSICFDIALDINVRWGVEVCLRNRGFDTEKKKTTKLITHLTNYCIDRGENSVSCCFIINNI